VTAIDLLANNDRIGGGEVMLLRIGAEAQRLGCDVRIVGPTFAGELEEAAGQAGLPFVPVNGRDRRAYAVALARRTRKDNASLLWCNGLVPAVATRASAGRRVVHLHQVPTAGQRRLLGAARRSREPVLVPSAFAAAHVPGATVLENWTDAPVDADPGARVGAHCRIGYLGRLSPIKGVDILADAMRRLHDRDAGRYELVVAGDDRLVRDSDAARVRRALDDCGPSLTELGWVRPDALLGQVDVLVVPSVVDEAFGLVVAEAMAHRVPVVVTDAGALPEVIGRDHPWIVRRGDADALARAVEDAASDPEGASAAADAGWRRWRDRYSPEAGRARLEHLLRSLDVGGR
jgi:glycosyltransferase involved in cell wall biosynthesis